MARGNQDSAIVHRETFDNEDAIFDALDAALGSVTVVLPKAAEEK